MKRLLTIVITLVIAFLMYVVFKLLPDFYFNAGKYDYTKKDYVSAYNNLKIALKLNPKGILVRYYYVKTLLNLKPTLEVQKELYNISQAKLSDSANLISNKQISLWQEQIFSNIGENYIEKVPFNNQILRWDIKKFPLNVYIQNNSQNATASYVASIKNAFLEWQKASRNLLKFNFINTPQNANIIITINSSTGTKKCAEGENCKYIVAYTTPSLNGSLLKEMDMFFYDSNNLGQLFTPEEIYNTAIHEIGHALGIMGHSDNKNDVMFMESSSNSTINGIKTISQTDLNTLTLLYELIPDITNTPMEEYDQNHQFFSHIVMGNDTQITSSKILEAQKYILAAPNLPNGYIDLAGAYMEEKKYNQAVDALNKAQTLCSNNNELFVVYYNLTIIYNEIKDWQTALKYAEKAKALDNSDEIDGLMASINYNLGNIDAAKNLYIESLNKHPDKIIDAHNLATIYIKEFKFISAGKLLNKLIKANPEAKNDPSIKAYGLLIFLFK